MLAGYEKLHLDASMSCADDPGGSGAPLDEADGDGPHGRALPGGGSRPAREAGVAAPVYVIGTEVPAPGGERAGDAGPVATPGAPWTARSTWPRSAFAAAGLEEAWERVVAVVAQPGVEFGDGAVVAYDPAAAAGLVAARRATWPLVFEAHSTDYQTPAALARPGRDGFAILKVGPWLTFALREALFALEAIERELAAGAGPASSSRGLRETLETRCSPTRVTGPPTTTGDAADLRTRLAFSFSDRCRYYWAQPGRPAPWQRLLRNLGRRARSRSSCSASTCRASTRR